MLILVICCEGQHLRDEILYTIVHYIFSVHSVEMDEQDETWVSCCVLDCYKTQYCSGLSWLFCMSVCVCMPVVCLSVCLSVCLPACLSVCLSA